MVGSPDGVVVDGEVYDSARGREEIEVVIKAELKVKSQAAPPTRVSSKHHHPRPAPPHQPTHPPAPPPHTL